MAEVPRYVVDASVAVKWHLEDETYTQQAVAVLRDFRDERIALLAPEQIRYEVPSALRVAAQRRRIDEPRSRIAIEAFLNLGIHTFRPRRLILLGYDYSVQFGCSFYDALYLALAVMTRRPLLHADDKLRHLLAGRFPLELWIEHYRPAAT